MSEEIRVLLKEGLTTPDRLIKGKKIKPKNIEKTNSKVVAVFESKEKKRDLVCSIDLESGTFNCSCEDFQYRKILCKHLVSIYLRLPKQMKEKFLSSLREKKETLFKEGTISTGSERLDEFLGGGLPIGSITNLIGSSKIGKSLFCIQCSSLFSITTGKPVLYIDTETTFLSEEVQKRILGFFNKRFNGEASIDFVDIRDLTSFADFLGLNIKILPTETGKRLDAMIQYSTITEESPIFELMKDVGYGMLVIDSFSALIKRAIPVPPQQNFPARAAIINVLFGRLDEIVSKLRIPCITVNHISIAPDNPYAKGRLYGGTAMFYNSKLILQILSGKDKDKRRFRLVYMPGRTEEEIEIELRKDFGYI